MQPCTSDYPITAMAQALADEVMALRCKFTLRLRSGEELSSLELERFEDLNLYARSLHLCLENGPAPSDAEWIAGLAKLVRAASKPYSQSHSEAAAALRPPRGRPRKQQP